MRTPEFISTIKGLLIVCCCCLQFVSAGQIVKDSAKVIAAQTIDDNDDKIFTKAEQMPVYKTGIQSLADTLQKVLLKNNTAFTAGKTTYSFIVHESGKVTDVQVKLNTTGDPSLNNQVISFLSHTNYLWNAAVQNGRRVNAFKVISITFNERSLTITELDKQQAY